MEKKKKKSSRPAIKLVLLYPFSQREKDNLHCIEGNITRGNSSHKINDESCDIDSKLKLDEFLDICIYRTTPSDNLNSTTTPPPPKKKEKDLNFIAQ